MNTHSRRDDQIQEIQRRTGLDEAQIACVVHAFYRRVRADRMLGPILAVHIAEADWPVHLDRMVAF